MIHELLNFVLITILRGASCVTKPGSAKSSSDGVRSSSEEEGKAAQSKKNTFATAGIS